MNMKVITRTLPQPAQSNAQPLIRRSIPAAQQAAQNGGANAQQRALTNQRLTVATTPGPIYGCTGLFDLCGDADLMSLSFQGQEPFLDWIGWEGTDICEIKRNYIAWERPAYSGASPTAGYLADPCGDANTFDWGTCDFVLTDFARLRRRTPPRDVTKVGLNRCVTSPRYRLDGALITNDLEWDTRIVTEVQQGDLKRMIVNGNAATPGQFSGLEVLVNDDYHSSNGNRCRSLDSNVIDWNANDMDGGAGITWNGVAQSATAGFIAFLYAAIRLNIQRIKWSGSLSSQNLEVGDIAFVAPSRLIQCVLDAYTCYRVCEGGQYTENNLNSYEARAFRDKLNGGLYGAGSIFVDGIEVPMIAYDWGLLKSDTLNDAYLLTRKVGGVRTFSGQYNDLRVAQQILDAKFDVTDGGRLLSWYEDDQTCLQRNVEMQPRLLMPAPYLQTRFESVRCQTLGPNLGPDAAASDSFFVEDSFISAGS